MMLKFIFPLHLMIILLVQAGENKFYVASSDVYMRGGPSTSYEPLAVISKGDTVQILETANSNWATIKHDDLIGYASIRFFQEITIPEEQIIEDANLNLNEEDEDISLLPFLFFCLITGSLMIILASYLGANNNRNRTFATLLALFFGFIGLQKFYLGRVGSGMLSLLFFWTFLPALIGFWDTIKLAFMDETKFQKIYNRKTEVSNRTVNKQKETHQKKNPVITSNSYNPNPLNLNTKNSTPGNLKAPDSATDKSIIDVNDEEFDLRIKNERKPSRFNLDETSFNIVNHKNYPHKHSSEFTGEVPFWSQFYVYSYDDIDRASKIQRKFYFHFRNKVTHGEWVDIRGNTNYAFILYFDFLKEYEIDQNVQLLEDRLKLLGSICPKTRSYSLTSLLNILHGRNDEYSKTRRELLKDPYSQFKMGFTDYDPSLLKLGRKFKEKLNLSVQQVDWLNKFYNPTNVFNSIEGCCTGIILNYLDVLSALENKFISNGKTLPDEVKFLKNLVKNEVSPYQQFYDFNYMSQRVEEEIYLTIFKRVENSVRESYGHTRKISDGFPYFEKNLSVEFEERIGNTVNSIIEEVKPLIKKPDLPTQIELNSNNVNRWKGEMKEISSGLSRKNFEGFIKEIDDLEIANQKNPNIENIFFEASKLMAKYDKTKALEYYLKYIHYDLNSNKIHNKQLTKTVQKSLFPKEEQLHTFEKIIQDLVETKNLETALGQVSNFYTPKRRKIQLDKNEIEETKKRHSKTVDLLSGYLEDKTIPNTPDTYTQFEKEEEEEIDLHLKKTGNLGNSLYLDELNFNAVQEELINEIIKNSYSLKQESAERIATKNGLLKNQLIDGINEICFGSLDGEVLIEEDEEDYIIEKSFYEVIIKK